MTRWLDAEEREAWLGLAGVTLLLPGQLDAQLQRDAGLNMFEYLVLAMLSEAPGRTMQLKRLALVVNGSLSRLSHTLTRLESRGWVQRAASSCDGRARVATLTEEGYAKVVDSAPGHVEAVRNVVFDAIEPDQVAQLAAIMRCILTGIDPAWYPSSSPAADESVAAEEPKQAASSG